MYVCICNAVTESVSVQPLHLAAANRACYEADVSGSSESI